MACNGKEVQNWRQRDEKVRFRPFTFPVLHHEDSVRSPAFERGDVRSGNLHLFGFVKVRVLFGKRIGAAV